MQWLWIFPGVGAVLLVIGAVLAVGTRRFQAGAAHGSAEVIGYREYDSSNDNGGYTHMYDPILRLEGVTREDGSALERTTGMGTSWRPYKIGARLRVILHEDDPEKFRIDSFGRLYFVPLLLGGMGICFLGIGLAVVFGIGNAGNRSEVLSEPPGVQESR